MPEEFQVSSKGKKNSCLFHLNGLFDLIQGTEIDWTETWNDKKTEDWKDRKSRDCPRLRPVARTRNLSKGLPRHKVVTYYVRQQASSMYYTRNESQWRTMHPLIICPSSKWGLHSFPLSVSSRDADQYFPTMAFLVLPRWYNSLTYLSLLLSSFRKPRRSACWRFESYLSPPL